jgi:hypothetical protein
MTDIGGFPTELEAVRLFRMVNGGLPEGELRPVTDDPPDCVVRSETATVGIEVTRLFQPSSTDPDSTEPPLQAAEVLQQRVADQALAAYGKTAGPTLRVAIWFARRPAITKRRVLPLARQISAMVIAADVDPGEHAVIEYSWGNRAWFPEELTRIDVDRFGRPVGAVWSAPRGGIVHNASPTELQYAIDGKEAGLDRYRHKYDQCWLLMVIAGQSPSTSIDLPAATLAHVYPCRFDRVTVLTFFGRRFSDLLICRREGGPISMPPATSQPHRTR